MIGSAANRAASEIAKAAGLTARVTARIENARRERGDNPSWSNEVVSQASQRVVFIGCDAGVFLAEGHLSP